MLERRRAAAADGMWDRERIRGIACLEMNLLSESKINDQWPCDDDMKELGPGLHRNEYCLIQIHVCGQQKNSYS